MKRIVLAITIALFIGNYSFAIGNQPVPKWNSNINVNKLSSYLKLESSQTEEVNNITAYFSEQMTQATRSKKNQNKKLANAVYGNLKLMKQTLTKEQYTKYLKLLNVTLQNKGIILE